MDHGTDTVTAAADHDTPALDSLRDALDAAAKKYGALKAENRGLHATTMGLDANLGECQRQIAERDNLILKLRQELANLLRANDAREEAASKAHWERPGLCTEPIECSMVDIDGAGHVDIESPLDARLTQLETAVRWLLERAS
jgi:hypothetical protein